MSMRLLLAFVAFAALAVACSSDPSEPVVIERIDVDALGLVFDDAFDPALAKQYPDVVARVNGKRVSGSDLVLYQVGTSGRSLLEIDPLETAIDMELLAQAGERLGHGITHEQAVEIAIAIERNTKRGLSEEELARHHELSLARGWPAENWGESDVVVKAYQRSSGIGLTMTAECDPPDPRRSGGSECDDFLSEERENADIEYFVVWAE